MIKVETNKLHQYNSLESRLRYVTILKRYILKNGGNDNLQKT